MVVHLNPVYTKLSGQGHMSKVKAAEQKYSFTVESEIGKTTYGAMRSARPADVAEMQK